MKKLLLALLLCTTTLVNAQLADCDIMGRYTTFYEWSPDADNYIKTGDGFMQTYIELREDYYTVKTDNMDKSISYWVFVGKTDKGDWKYGTEDGRRILFTSEEPFEMVIFYEYITELGRYSKAIILSKLSIKNIGN